MPEVNAELLDAFCPDQPVWSAVSSAIKRAELQRLSEYTVTLYCKGSPFGSVAVILKVGLKIVPVALLSGAS